MSLQMEQLPVIPLSFCVIVEVLLAMSYILICIMEGRKIREINYVK
jgi:hypothetical protein